MLINHLIDYIKYLIKECYEEDYDPYYADFWYDNYCYQYTFSEWYFLYRYRFNLKKYKNNHYKHTPAKLIIGSDFWNSCSVNFI